MSKIQDFCVTISLLNPFQDDLYKTLEPVFATDYSSLQNMTRVALKRLQALKDSLKEDQQKRFIIKMHNALPFGSAIILDCNHEQGRVQIETKPYKVHMRESFAFEFLNNGGQFYKTIVSSYFSLIEDGVFYENLLH